VCQSLGSLRRSIKKKNQTELFLPNSRIQIANRKTDSCCWVKSHEVSMDVRVCVVECWMADSAVNPASFGIIICSGVVLRSTVCCGRVWQLIVTLSRYETWMQWYVAHRAISTVRLWMIHSENWIIVDSVAFYQESSDLFWRVRQVDFDIEQVCDGMMFCSQCTQFC